MIKKVAVFGQTYSVNAEKEISILLTALEKHNVVVFFEENFYNVIKDLGHLTKRYPTFASFHDLNSSFDLFFSLGGDGTILRAITYIRDLNIPILGINTGRLGFLANIQKNAIQESIDLLIAEKYTIQERTLLSIRTSPAVHSFGELSFALNEITIARENTTSMIGVKTFLDKEYLTNYWSDGLIIATPTGSTGYSLSCGGPILTPDTNNLIITPISPHNLGLRSLVVSDKSIIKLIVESQGIDFLVSMDSRSFTCRDEEKLIITKSNFKINLIQPNNFDFFDTLRNKLNWGYDFRN